MKRGCVNDKWYVFDTRNKCKLEIRWFVLYLIRGKTVTFQPTIIISECWARMGELNRHVSFAKCLTFNTNISNVFSIHRRMVRIGGCMFSIRILRSLFCCFDGENPFGVDKISFLFSLWFESCLLWCSSDPRSFYFNRFLLVFTVDRKHLQHTNSNPQR